MEAELFHEGLVFKKYGLYNSDVMPSPIAAGAGQAPSGFTKTDLAALSDLSAAALSQRRWSRTQFVHGPSADYLAAWTVDAGDAEPPHLAIARFKQTGTYVLTVGAQVVETTHSLNKILSTIRQVLVGSAPQAPALA
jgi:hypothetical protein